VSLFDEILNNRLHTHDGETFTQCQMCSRALTEDDFYLIAKAYDRGRLVLETAQCFACQLRIRSNISEQSQENLQLYGGRSMTEFFTEPFAKQFYYLGEPSCLITSEVLAVDGMFELYTLCSPSIGDGDDYFLIGPTAIEQMSELLSKETRKTWERFLEDLDPDLPEVVVSPMFVH